MSDDVVWNPVTVAGVGNPLYDIPGSSLMPAPNGSGGFDSAHNPTKITAGTAVTQSGSAPNITVSGGTFWNQLIGVVNYRLTKLQNAGYNFPTGIAFVAGIAGLTVINEQTHLLNLRSQIDYIRQCEGHAQFTWTDFPQINPPVAGTPATANNGSASTYTNTLSPIKGYHLAELRKALAGHYDQTSMADSFTGTLNRFVNNVFPQFSTLNPCIMSDCFNYQGAVTATIQATAPSPGSPQSQLHIYISTGSGTLMSIVTSPIQKAAVINVPTTYSIVATNSPTSYAQVGSWPAGISLNPVTGVITCLVSSAANYQVTVAITNTQGTRHYISQAQITFVVTDPSNPPPSPYAVLSSPAAAMVQTGGPITDGNGTAYTITSDIGTSYSAGGLPTGASLSGAAIIGNVTTTEFAQIQGCTPTFLSTGYSTNPDWRAIAGNRESDIDNTLDPTQFQVTRTTATFVAANKRIAPPSTGYGNHLQAYEANPYGVVSPAALQIDYSVMTGNAAGVEFWIGDYGPPTNGSGANVLFTEIALSSGNGATATLVVGTGSAATVPYATSPLSAFAVTNQVYTTASPIYTITATAAFSAQIRGTLPPGLLFDSTTNTIFGTPTTAGSTVIEIVLTRAAVAQYFYLQIIVGATDIIPRFTSPGNKQFTAVSNTYTMATTPASTYTATGMPSGMTQSGSTIIGAQPAHNPPACNAFNTFAYDPITNLNSNVGDSMHLVHTTSGSESGVVSYPLTMLPGSGIKPNHAYLVHMRVNLDDVLIDNTAQHIFYTGSYVNPIDATIQVGGVQIVVHWNNISGPG